MQYHNISRHLFHKKLLLNFAFIDIIYAMVTSELAQLKNGKSGRRHAKQILARWKQTRRVRAHEIQAGGREGKEVFQERELFARLNGRGSSKEGGEGGRRWAAAPSRYIDRRSARLFRILKGKFPFIRAGFSPAELFEGARLADSSSDGK